jgi:hypothetical protein
MRLGKRVERCGASKPLLEKRHRLWLILRPARLALKDEGV